MVSGRGAVERLFDGAGQRFDLKRLLQRRPVAIFRWQSRRSIAGCEDEGPVARGNQVGDWRNHLAVDVDVENGKIELDRLGKAESVADFAGLGNNGVAELFKHI